MNQETPFKRTIRSFVRREGRMTPSQQRAMNELWPIYGIDFSQTSLDFEKLFGNTNPVNLEIGFGNGESLLQMAMNSPDENFLGVEVHRPGVGKLLNDIEEHQLKNLRIMAHDAVEVLQNMIPTHSLHKVFLFFPDPWHKKRHHKRRIVQTTFAKKIAEKLIEHGQFHMATDWENYAMHMLEILEAMPEFKNIAGKNNFSQKPDYRPTTKFEKRGERLGHGVWDLIFELN